MEFERKRAKTREERLRERRLSKLERKEERLLEEKQPSFLSRKAAAVSYTHLTLPTNSLV